MLDPVDTYMNTLVPMVDSNYVNVRKAVLMFDAGAVAGVVGIEVGVVSGVFNLESSGVDAPDWRPRHEEH